MENQEQSEDEADDRPKGIPLSVIDSRHHLMCLCGYCELILRSPLQTSCGHRYCRNCLGYLQRLSERQLCPLCQKEGSQEYLQDADVFPDRALLREFRKIKATCLNQGCLWSDTLDKYEEHERLCDFIPFLCTLCKQMWPSCQKTTHPCEPPVCEFVGCGAKVKSTTAEHHNEQSQRSHLHSLNEAVVGIESQLPDLSRRLNLVQQLWDGQERPTAEDEQEAGVRRDGPSDSLGPSLSGFPSTSEPLGAEALPLRNIRGSSVAFNSASAGGLQSQGSDEPVAGNATNSVGVTGSETVSVTDSDPSTFGDIYSSAAAAATDSAPQSTDTKITNIKELKTQIETLTTAIQEVKTETQALGHEHQDKERKIQQMKVKVRDLDGRINNAEARFKQQVDFISSLEAQVFSMDGELVWKIANFIDKLEEAKRGINKYLISRPFLTGPTGYKLAGKFYPNGDGMGLGSHVSLFTFLYSTENDPLLKWPFSQKVTLMMLQQGGDRHVVDAFMPDGHSASFKRPRSGQVSVASGAPLFVQQSVVLDPARRLVGPDGSVFIKIAVDTTGLNP